MVKSKTYLVIGANGFVGSSIVEHIAKIEGARVKAFDRFSRKPDFITTDNVEIIKGDILNDTDLEQALKGVDYLVHSYSATTPFISDNDPYVDIENNLKRSIDIFRLSIKLGVKKVYFISTGGAVYGSAAEKGIVDETTMPLPVSPYGINKLAIEHYLEYFKRKNGLDYTVYRLTNPYGPRQRANKNQGVVPAFLNKIGSNETITIFGDGSATRDYIFMDDAAAMIVNSFNAHNTYNIYNIGSGRQTSLKELIRAIEKAVGRNDIEIEYQPSPATFLSSTSVSIQRYINDFGEITINTLEEGLSKTVHHD